MEDYKKWAAVTINGRSLVMPYKNAMDVFEAMVSCDEMYEVHTDGWDKDVNRSNDYMTNVSLYQFLHITPVPASYVALMKVKGVE